MIEIPWYYTGLSSVYWIGGDGSGRRRVGRAGLVIQSAALGVCWPQTEFVMLERPPARINTGSAVVFTHNFIRSFSSFNPHHAMTDHPSVVVAPLLTDPSLAPGQQWTNGGHAGSPLNLIQRLEKTVVLVRLSLSYNTTEV